MSEHIIRIIKRGGGDGQKYPVQKDEVTFGSEQTCDIRVKVPNVEKLHTVLNFASSPIELTNKSNEFPTKVNGVPIVTSHGLKHGDVFTIIDRSFRYESTSETKKMVEAQEKENLSTPPPNKKRKSKIVFGPDLTPEEFDKKLPPSEPLSRGRTPPRRGSTGFSILKGADKSVPTIGILDTSATEEESLNLNISAVQEKKNGFVVPSPKKTPKSARRSSGRVINLNDSQSVVPDTCNATKPDDNDEVANKSEIIDLHDSYDGTSLPGMSPTAESETADAAKADTSLNKSVVVDLNSDSICSATSDASSAGLESSDDNIMIFNTTTESEASTEVSDATELNTTVDELFRQQEQPQNPKSEAAKEISTPKEGLRKSQRKSVRFGPALSPEEYDTNLPANTPIRKGALPSRYSLPNPQNSAGRTPFRKSVAVLGTAPGTPVGQLKSNDDSIDSLNSEDQDSATRARTQRRKTMTPREIKANISWAGSDLPSSKPERKSAGAVLSTKKVHVDSPIVKTPIQRLSVAINDSVIEEEESVTEDPEKEERADKEQSDSSSKKVFGKKSSALKTPVSAKLVNPALGRASPPTPIPFVNQTNQAKSKGLHEDLQRASLKRALLEESKQTDASEVAEIKSPKSPRTKPRVLVKPKTPTMKTKTSVTKPKTPNLEKRAKDKSPLKPRTPSVKPKSPVTKQSPTVKSGTPTSKPKSTVTKIKTPVLKIKIPVLKPRTPASTIKTPVSKVKSPVSKVKTPVSKVKTPASKVKTPTSKVKTPTSKVKTPTSKVKTPLSKVKIPVTKPKTPLSKPKTPLSKPKTPVSKPKTPVTKPKTPVSKPKTPKTHGKSPTNKASTGGRNSLHEVKEMVTNNNKPISEKRSSLENKRLIVEKKAKTWSSVASKLTQSPWKAAPTSTIVRLPPKTPLRDRALRAMGKTKIAKPKPVVIIKEAKRKSQADAKRRSGVLKPTVKPVVKRLGVGNKTPSKRVSMGRAKVAKVTTSVKSEENKDNLVNLVEIFSDDYQPDSVSQLCALLDPVVQHQYHHDENFEFGTVSTVLKDTETGPHVDPYAMRKLFKTPRKSVPTAEIDAISLMRLFVNPDFVKSSKKEVEIDTIAMKKLFKTPKKRQSIVYDADFISKMFDDRRSSIYKEPDEEGNIIDKENAEHVIRKSVLRRSINPGDLCRLFALPKVDKLADLSGVAELFNEPDEIDTLCAVMSPLVKMKYSQDENYDFGTLDAVLKKDKNSSPEIDPYALRKLFHTPKTKNTEVIDPVSLIRLFLNPELVKKSPRRSAILDPIAMRNMFRTPKKPKLSQPAEIDSLALLKLFAEEQPQTVYQTVDTEKVDELLKKSKNLRKSLNPGDLCKLFTLEKQYVDPNISGVADLFNTSNENIPEETVVEPEQNSGNTSKAVEKHLTKSRTRTRAGRTRGSPIATNRKTRGQNKFTTDDSDTISLTHPSVATTNVAQDDAELKDNDLSKSGKTGKGSIRQTRATKAGSIVAENEPESASVVAPKTAGKSSRKIASAMTESADELQPSQTRDIRSNKLSTDESTESDANKVTGQTSARATRRTKAQTPNVVEEPTKTAVRKTRRKKVTEAADDESKLEEAVSSLESSNTASQAAETMGIATGRRPRKNNILQEEETGIELPSSNQVVNVEIVEENLPVRKSLKVISISTVMAEKVLEVPVRASRRNKITNEADATEVPGKTPAKRGRGKKLDEAHDSGVSSMDIPTKTLKRSTRRNKTDDVEDSTVAIPTKTPKRSTRRNKTENVDSTITIPTKTPKRSTRRNKTDNVEDLTIAIPTKTPKRSTRRNKTDDGEDSAIVIPTKTPKRSTRGKKVDEVVKPNEKPNDIPAKSSKRKTPSNKSNEEIITMPANAPKRSTRKTVASTDQEADVIAHKMPASRRTQRNQKEDNVEAKLAVITEVSASATRSSRRRKVEPVNERQENNYVSEETRKKVKPNNRTKAKANNDYEELEKALAKLETENEEEAVSDNTSLHIDNSNAAAVQPKRTGRSKPAAKSIKAQKKTASKKPTKKQLPKRLSTIAEEAATPVKPLTRSSRRKR